MFFKNLKKLGYRYFSLDKRNLKDKKIIKSFQRHYSPNNVTGKIDPITGYVMDMKVLKDLIKVEVEDAFDHKNLNEQVSEFEDLIPTAENIAVVIYNKLLPHLDEDKSLEIVLYETPRNFVRFSG